MEHLRRADLAAITLIVFSPVVSGKPADPVTGLSPSMITDATVDFHWFPLDNPGIVSIPLAFFLGWLGTVTSKERSSEAKYAEMEVRSLTGAGAEKAVVALTPARVRRPVPSVEGAGRSAVRSRVQAPLLSRPRTYWAWPRWAMSSPMHADQPDAEGDRRVPAARRRPGRGRRRSSAGE